jgi:hypothetical protein
MESTFIGAGTLRARFKGSKQSIVIESTGATASFDVLIYKGEDETLTETVTLTPDKPKREIEIKDFVDGERVYLRAMGVDDRHGKLKWQIVDVSPWPKGKASAVLDYLRNETK